jgi:hypothetical protein
MRTSIFIIILFAGFSWTSAQNEPEDYVKTFFELIGEQKYAEAIDNLPANKTLQADTAFNTKLISKLNVLKTKGGEYCGYELIEKEIVTPSLVNYTFLLKYANIPQRVLFTFYMPKQSWQLIQINIIVQNRQSNTDRKQGFRQQQ